MTCAANGVDFRDPLKPAEPADSHTMTLPSLSVSATIVLLKDDLICAWPMAMFFLTWPTPALLRCLPWGRHYVAFLTADGLGRALRVRAFVFVRWPIGRPYAADALVGADLPKSLHRLRPITSQITDLEARVDVPLELRRLGARSVLDLRLRREAEVGETFSAVAGPMP